MIPKPGDPNKSWEPFRCEDVCQDRQRGRWLPNERAQRNCKRVDLPRVEPDVYMPRLLHYMGRRADPNLDAAHWTGIAKAYLGSKEPWWKKPPEDWRQGCPGAWIRSPFNYSFSRYARGRDDNGGRVQNHHLDSCKDWLVIDGVHYFEREENRRIAFHEKVAWEAIDAKRRSAQGNKR